MKMPVFQTAEMQLLRCMAWCGEWRDLLGRQAGQGGDLQYVTTCNAVSLQPQKHLTGVSAPNSVRQQAPYRLPRCWHPKPADTSFETRL